MSFIVKICGLTCLADALSAVTAGADWLGLVFYPPSPRAVTCSQAREIVAGLPASAVPVGVFVQPTAAQVRQVARAAGLRRVQLHGAGPGLFAELAEWLPIRAFPLRQEADLRALDAWPEGMVLVDTPSPDWGGSGRTGDWKLAAAAARRRPILLAGGLQPDNVAAAIRAVRPAGVDVSSGVEASPGHKDHARIAAFVKAARAAAAEVAP